MKEIYENARKLMKGYCRVCPECNGKACAGEVPGMGGLGTAAAFKENINALHSIRFNMRLIHDVSEPDTTISLLGRQMALPLLAAPIGGVSFNMGGEVSEQAYIQAILRGCKEKGIMGCTGDGVPDFIHETGLAEIQAVGGHGIAFIKPWADKELFEKIQKVRDTGANTIGIDIDAAGLITLKQMGRPVFPRGIEKLREIIQKASMKFILKGVMTVKDANAAVKAGADAIVVSNHGGRVFEFTPGAASVLPAIADAVKGQVAILADGGVRSGGDVLKLLALGADAVMIGRPFSMAAVGGLQVGVESYIDMIRTQLEQAMVLTGVKKASQVPSNIIFQSA